MKVLSLDVSAACTGWCVFYEDKISYGLIKTSSKKERAERLSNYKKSLTNIINKYEPNHVVMEDIFVGLNATTIKVLAEFAGVTKLVCLEEIGISPYVISNNTVKSYYKCGKKEKVFDFLVDTLSLDWTFKKYNDIIDAIAQLCCYCDLNLGFDGFRQSYEYGYLYTIKREDLNNG